MASFARDRNYHRSGHEYHDFFSTRDNRNPAARVALKRLIVRLNRRLKKDAINEQLEWA